MFLTRSEYDRGVNTFSPEGRLFQVEYAIEAIKLGSTTVGISTPHGVVLGVEKRVQSPLLEASSIEKIVEIDKHLGCAMSGLTADARTMIDHARVTSQNHAFTYDEKIKVESVTQAVCDLALRFGESMENEDAMMSRPFGVALLVAGIDELGPQLFHTDPSGTMMKYEAKAIGSGSEAAQAELQDKYHKQMSLLEAHKLTLRVLKQVMEEKLDQHNVQLAQVTPEGGFEILSETKLREVIDDMFLTSWLATFKFRIVNPVLSSWFPFLTAYVLLCSDLTFKPMQSLAGCTSAHTQSYFWLGPSRACCALLHSTVKLDACALRVAGI